MDDYVTIETAPNEPIADMLKERLDEAGIPCVVVPGNLGAVAGAAASFQVNVPPDRADEARELLSD
jgi:hypothetical protein